MATKVNLNKSQVTMALTKSLDSLKRDAVKWKDNPGMSQLIAKDIKEITDAINTLEDTK